jgi:NAD(P)H-hydrate epimerase
MVSMTYFASPEDDKDFANQMKSSMGSFVWVPRDDIYSYVEKSDAILIGPGLMRSHVKEMKFVCDEEGMKTRKITIELLKKYPNNKWIVDGGSLQVISVEELPKGTIVTPNHKEFEMLFREKEEADLVLRAEQVYRLAKKYDLVILTKDSVAIASDGKAIMRIEGGNDGLVKGGVGDVIAGITLGFLAKNDGLFSVSAATYLVKKAAEKLAEKVGLMFSSDDLVQAIPEVYKETMVSL